MSAPAKDDDHGSDASHDGDGAAAPKSKKKMIIAIAAVLLFAAGGVGAYFMGLFGGGKTEEAAHTEEGAEPAAGHEENGHEEKAADAKGDDKHAADAAPDAHGKDAASHGDAAHSPTGKDGKPVIAVQYHPLPDFLVNLNSATKRSSFLKVTIALEIPDAESMEIVKAYEPKIIDSFQTYLRELRPEDLKGSGGIFRLREDLMLRVNKIVQPAKVNDILFKEMIVQ